MNYHPNLSDPRVIKRITFAYGAAVAVLSETTPHHWAKAFWDKPFGSQNHPLSNWLRRHLLITTNNHYSMDDGVCKQYIINKKGRDYIRSIIKDGTRCPMAEWVQQNPERSLPETNSKSEVEQVSYLMDSYPSVALLFDLQVIMIWARREFGSDLASLNFNYADKSGRLWHSLQKVTTVARRQIQKEAGLKWVYDISSCAPTLIMQHAQQLGLDEYLFGINSYIKNKKHHRETIAKLVDIDEKLAKVLINALFCGARLGANKQFALWALLDQSYDKVKTLQKDEFVTVLKNDISLCWKQIEPTMSKRTVTSAKTGRERKIPANSKQKWAVYFRLERKILDTVVEYLNSKDIKVFLEHDGWVTNKQLDIQDLQLHIFNETGFKVVLEEEEIV